MRRPPEWTEFSRYPVTAGTIALAAAATAAWWLHVDISQLLDDPHIRRGQLWRLITDVLPHVNIIHLAFNVMWLWTFGTIVEGAFGHLRTLAMFVFFAVCSSAAEYAILDGGVGLSGVVYGLFGLLWVLHRRDPRFADAMDSRIVQLFIGWFLLCIVLTVINVMPVGNIAHGVGAISGAALAWCLTIRNRAVITAAVSLLLISTLAAATIARPHVNLSPNAGLGDGRLGYDALQRGDNTEAARWLTDATKMSPRQASLWYNLGIALERLKRYPESLIAYNRAYELEPRDNDYRQAYQNMERWLNHR
jgi:membrane associated rhomboid family serine protease